MKNKFIRLFGFVAGCIVVGFVSGRHFGARPQTMAHAESPGNERLSPDTIAQRGAFVSKTTRQVQSMVEEWRALQGGLCTPEAEERMRDLLKSLGASDPLVALDLTQNASTPRQREVFRNAILQGWAMRDPQAAADWTLKNVRYDERRVAVEALAVGALAQPETAFRVFRGLVSSDPLLASDHGNALVGAFVRAGDFQIANRFAADGPAEFRAAWLCTVYNQWAIYQPRAALVALEKIADSAAAQEARAAFYAGWGASDPAGLVAYTQTLPAGDARFQALSEGLAQWVHRDPVAASAWMDKREPSLELDAGAAAIAIAPALIAKRPDVAVSWAESIANPELRASTLLDLIRLWAEHDAAAARRYAASSAVIAPDTRELALAILQSSP